MHASVFSQGLPGRLLGKSGLDRYPESPIQLIQRHYVGALIIRIGFWGPLYYISNKEPPPKKKIVLIII